MKYSKTTKKTNPVQKEIDTVIKVILDVDNDPIIRKRAEESHKKLSYISPEDLLTPFRTY